MTSDETISDRRGWLALSPVVLFMLLYVVASVVIGDFYRIPVSVALVVASVWSVIIYRGIPLGQRIDTFSRAAGNYTIIYMLWIFILAGAFASVAVKIGAVDAAVNSILDIFPARWIVPAMFVASCLISFSIGTSVGTVVALTPLAVSMSSTAGVDTAYFVGAVLGGAFFGDNLSFISDTTIASTRSQGCDMADKFKANVRIAVPAALITLGVYLLAGPSMPERIPVGEANPWLTVPYALVILLSVAGMNVAVVLTLGILAAIVTGLCNGFGILDLAGFMGAGVDSMGDLIIITLLAAGMLGVIKAAGGIRYLLDVLTRRVSGVRGAQGVICLLVGMVNLCTANNTVAIITVGSMSRDIAQRYGVDRRKTASLLDSTSCIVQCLIPYGAQTLLATSLAGLSPAAPFIYLYYPWALAVMVLLSIIFGFPKFSKS